MKKIFLTLALGVATITFAQQMDRPAKMDPEQRKAEMQKKQQEHLDKMSKDLNLSQDQVKKIKDLQDKQMADMQKKYAAKRGGKKSQNGRNEEKARCPRSGNEKNINARTIPKMGCR